MKIIFAGTPEFAAQHLQVLLDNNVDIVAVYTQPDRPAGRGKKLTPSPVKSLALSHDIPVFQPPTLKSEAAQQELAELQADLMIVVAYGLILPKTVLQTPSYGCINVHGSLLPSWRGAAPIQRAIWAGDSETGVTIMQMDEGLDTGAMLLKAVVPIAANDTSASLYNKLAEIGPSALLEVVNKLPELAAEPQNDNNASYAQKLSKAEAEIDWQLPAEQLERNTRAFNPWPICWFSLDDKAIKVWQLSVLPETNKPHQAGEVISVDKQGITVATGSSPVLLTQLQIPGKKPMSVVDILNARKDMFTPGQIL